MGSLISKRQAPEAEPYDRLWLELGLYVDEAMWKIFLNESNDNETLATMKVNSFMQGVVDIVAVDYLALYVPIIVVVTKLVSFQFSGS